MELLLGLVMITILMIGMVYSFRSIRQALALTLIVGGAALCFTGWGIILGLPAVFFGGWLASVGNGPDNWNA